MVSFQIYKIPVTERKQGICPNDILAFNEELENLSKSVIELTNIDESSCDNKNLFGKNRNRFLIEDGYGNDLSSHIQKYIYTIITIE